MAQPRKTRSSKSDIRKRLLEQERARMEARVDMMSTIVAAIADIDDLTLKASAAIGDLQDLGVTHADIELATGISSSRIAKIRREAAALDHDDSDNEDNSQSPDADNDQEDKGELVSRQDSDK